MNKLLLKDWKLLYGEKMIPAEVPGDITIDMFKAGLVSNPYIAENYKESTWVGKTDFDYINTFEINKEFLTKNEVISIYFGGIDLFADIYINDILVGKTNNAFMAFEFDIKQYLKEGSNTLRVAMKSTLNAMDKIDTKGYFAIFNTPRLFVRKPQCHFGWDWAPKICAYGITDVVEIRGKHKQQINDVRVIADDEGNLRLHVDVNYDNKDLFGPDCELIKKSDGEDNDLLVYLISKDPFGKEFDRYETKLMGYKNYLAIKKENPKLWWPTGYGEQNLYNYRIELYRSGELKDFKEGRFGFRSVVLKEEPKENNAIGMDFYINGVKVYLKGSNWVPPECFTGTMKKEKYVEMIKLAKNMNLNILRVWGGGDYEKDIFFDTCDELGILTWQDIALACADIPEEIPEFVDSLLEEVKYQVKRLRNHPSLIYWCGGNEKTGSYRSSITHGDNLVNCVLPGVINYLDGTRPYKSQSPHSYTDVGNDFGSGDSHYGNFEGALNKGMKSYRHEISNHVVPFVSECSVLGCSSEETVRKIFPEDKLWPLNDMWKDRFMENPYASILMDFPHRELYYAESLFGKVSGLSDFVMKSMAAHAEALRAECEFSRAHTDITGAWLNWMFDDIWPSGTWSVLDYYLEPKQAYYQLKRSYKPLLLSFFEDNDGHTNFFIDNQTLEDYKGKVEFGVKTFNGDIVFTKTLDVKVEKFTNIKELIDDKHFIKNVYCYVKYNENGKEIINLYSPSLYMNGEFGKDFSYSFKALNENKVIIKIHANEFIKSLFLHFDNNYEYIYSDNYLDLEKGQEVEVTITSKNKIDVNKIKFLSL